MTDSPYQWTEEDSEQYRQLGAVWVPAREEQIATLLTLLPFEQHDSFRAVELACGEGALAFAILDYFPNASVTALDGSPSMRVHAAECLRSFGRRASVEPFDLASDEWHPRLEGADCVLSSLTLHHLPDGDKRRLFAAVSRRLAKRGAFLIADILQPQRPEQRTLFAEVYDRVVKAQSVAATGSDEIVRKSARWNFYRYGSLSGEYPSPLFEQLTWLAAADFEVVDCFWLQAGFAIYGGYKARVDVRLRSTQFASALRSAQTALDATSPVPFRQSPRGEEQS